MPDRSTWASRIADHAIDAVPDAGMGPVHTSDPSNDELRAMLVAVCRSCGAEVLTRQPEARCKCGASLVPVGEAWLVWSEPELAGLYGK